MNYRQLEPRAVAFRTPGVSPRGSAPQLPSPRVILSSVHRPLASVDAIYPADIVPFTRKPLFLIVDSENSGVFKNIPNAFGQPFLCLMSPPATHPKATAFNRGNMFTLFLCDPLNAICSITGINRLNQQIFDEASRCIDSTLEIICKLLLCLNFVDAPYVSFLADEFLRQLVVRFAFSQALLAFHKPSLLRSYNLSSHPELPSHVRQNPQVVQGVVQLVTILDVQDQFQCTET